MPSAHATFCQCVLFGILGLLAAQKAGAVDVLTFHNDNFHSGANTSETVLNQNNVNAGTFGQIAQIPVDGDVFAQPLYVSGVTVVGNPNPVNALIVATEDDNVYCFDADTFQQYWVAQLGTPMPRSLVTSDTNYDVNVGITSTPVIDKVNGIIYVCGMTMITPNGMPVVINHNLWALNLSSGAVMNSAIISYSNGASTFVARKQGQRPALTLDQTGGRNNLYVAFASFSDQMVYCGYLFSFNPGTLAQQAVFQVCPAAYTSSGQDGGGIWMSGCGPAIDTNGDVLLVTGNGYADASGPPRTSNNYGEAIVRLNPSTLTVTDYYSPTYRAMLNNLDEDLGVGGLVLLPPQGGNVTNIVVHDSKEGKLYVENRNNLGQFNGTTDNIIQATNWFGGSLVKATPISWIDPSGTQRVFGAAESANPIISFTLNSTTGALINSLTSTNLDGTTEVSLTQMAISSNGNAAGTGILWAMSPTVGDPVHQFGPGILRAYNAETLQEIYNSAVYPHDALGYWPKNCAPLVANGKVYCASLTDYTSGLSNMIYVFSLLPVYSGLTATITSPQNNTITAVEPASITISADATSATTTVVKVDFFQGTTLIGTTTSEPWTFTWAPVYGSTYSLTALATDNLGYTSMSAPVTVTVPGVGFGSIEQEFYPNIAATSLVSALLADPNFPNAPQSISFPTTASGPYDNGIDDAGSRLIGYIYPPITGFYTFWICSEDASELYLSTDDAPTNQESIASVATWCTHLDWTQYSSQQSVPIYLEAGQRYFLQALQVQGDGGNNLDVGWQLPDGAGGTPGTYERPIQGSHLSPPTMAPLVSPPAVSGGNPITYTGPITVTITSAIPGQAIYYTTDGTTPTTASTPYTAPFAVLATTTITAVSVLTDTTSLAPAGTIVSPSTANAYTISGSAAYGEQTLPQLNASTLNAIITSPPGMLSQTGLFSSLSPLTPAAGILPYNVISPLWSDGANKDRFIALPAGRKIVYDPVNEFTFPADTVMIKNFVLTIDGVPTPLELRLIMLTGPNTGYGVTYKWNTGATDAILMGPGSPTMLQDGLDENEGSPTVQQVWHYPSRAECLQCHTNNAGFVLGAKARQLNTAFTYPSTMVTDNELRTWNYLQLFSTNIGENYMSLITLNNIGDPPPATVASIARSFLDSNCAQCHRLGGVTTLWDARFITPLAGQNIVNGPLLNTFGVLGAEVVYPQVVGASMIYLRMNTVNTTPPLPTLMPPLARHVIDTNAVTAMAAWINSLTPNQPVISSIAPSSGPVGTTVIIGGSAFSGTTMVTFNGTQATSFTVIADTSLSVTVPNGATTGPIVVTSCGLTATSATYAVIPTPIISSFTPANGPVGTVVTITGSGLSGATAVSFGATAASSFAVNSGTSITATIANSTAVGAATISVTTPGGVAFSASPFTVYPPPVISSFTPANGPVGTVVTITGSGLSGATAVTFGATAASSFTVNSATSITATIANGTAVGAAAIRINTSGGVASSNSPFMVFPPPSVTSIEPGSGVVGEMVTITGTGLSGTTAVAFNGTSAVTFLVNSDTQIDATVPAGATTGTVAVTTPGGTATSSTFTVEAATSASGQSPPASPPLTSGGSCGNGGSVLIGVLLLTAILRRLRLSDRP